MFDLVEQNLWADLSFKIFKYSMAKKKKLNNRFLSFFFSPYCKLENVTPKLSGEGVEMLCNSMPLSFPPQSSGRCFFQPRCLATNTQTNIQLQFTKTSKNTWISKCCSFIALLKSMDQIYDRPNMIFLQPHLSKSLCN